MNATKTTHLRDEETNAKICRNHFKESDLTTDGNGRKLLDPKAVPSLCLPGPLTLEWEHNYASVCKILK